MKMNKYFINMVLGLFVLTTTIPTQAWWGQNALRKTAGIIAKIITKPVHWTANGTKKTGKFIRSHKLLTATALGISAVIVYLLWPDPDGGGGGAEAEMSYGYDSDDDDDFYYPQPADPLATAEEVEAQFSRQDYFQRQRRRQRQDAEIARRMQEQYDFGHNPEPYRNQRGRSSSQPDTQRQEQQNSENICPLCRNEVHARDNITLACCQQRVHPACLRVHQFNIGNTCPKCKTLLPQERSSQNTTNPTHHQIEAQCPICLDKPSEINQLDNTVTLTPCCMNFICGNDLQTLHHRGEACPFKCENNRWRRLSISEIEPRCITCNQKPSEIDCNHNSITILPCCRTFICGKDLDSLRSDNQKCPECEKEIPAGRPGTWISFAQPEPETNQIEIDKLFEDMPELISDEQIQEEEFQAAQEQQAPSCYTEDTHDTPSQQEPQIPVVLSPSRLDIPSQEIPAQPIDQQQKEEKNSCIVCSKVANTHLDCCDNWICKTDFNACKLVNVTCPNCQKSNLTPSTPEISPVTQPTSSSQVVRPSTQSHPPVIPQIDPVTGQPSSATRKINNEKSGRPKKLKKPKPAPRIRRRRRRRRLLQEEEDETQASVQGNETSQLEQNETKTERNQQNTHCPSCKCTLGSLAETEKYFGSCNHGVCINCKKQLAESVVITHGTFEPRQTYRCPTCNMPDYFER